MNVDESTLLGRLRHRIRRHGPITFAEFMEAALYDPDQGFYARAPIGRDGHFVTSPHVSTAFGDLLARQLAECWEHLGRPDPFTVVELGAGDGTLARRIIRAVQPVPELAGSLRYRVVERTPGQAEALRSSALEVLGSLHEAAPLTGCVVANEVLDNVPFHRLRATPDGRLVEVMVGTDGDRLVEVEAEPTAEARAALVTPLAPGEERPVSPRALELIRDIAETLERGYAFLFDYGFVAGETPGPVHAYRAHRVMTEVLEDPGGRDVTAAVDLEAVAREAKASALQVWGPVTQRDALLSLGYRMWEEGALARQAESDPVTATRVYEERSRASILVDPAKLGGLYLLALGTKDLLPPAAIRGS